MVVDQREQEALDSLRRDRYHHLLVRQPEETDLRTLSRWPWIASLSANVYGVAESLDELPASPLLATDSADGIASGRTLRRGLHVPCDGRPTTIPSGPDGTLVRVSNDGSTTRVWASDELAPLPGRRAILLAQELATGGTVALHCSGPPLVVDVNEAVFPARA
jgi:hypothetical protein